MLCGERPELLDEGIAVLKKALELVWKTLDNGVSRNVECAQ
jgi:hypothetical protein